MTLEDAVEVSLVDVAGESTFSCRCALAKTVYDFLMGVKKAPGCPWYVKIAIRQLHGAISALRRKWGC